MTFPKRSLIASAITIALVGLVGNFQLTPARAAYSEITLGSAENYLLLAGSAITNGASTSFAGDGSRVTGIARTPHIFTFYNSTDISTVNQRFKAAKSNREVVAI